MNIANRFGAIGVGIGFILASLDTASAASFQYYQWLPGVSSESIYVDTPADGAGFTLVGDIGLYGAGANANQFLDAWCMDVFTYLAPSGTYQFSPLTTAGANGLNTTAENPALTATQIASIGSLMINGYQNLNQPNVSAATQLAIWTVEYGSSFTYDPLGNDPLASLVSTLVSEAAPGGSLYDPSVTVTLLSEVDNQSLGEASSVAPLPAAWILMLSGLAGLGVLGRQKS